MRAKSIHLFSTNLIQFSGHTHRNYSKKIPKRWICSRRILAVEGSFLPFGGEQAKLDFAVENADLDWSNWKPSQYHENEDIKNIWEPARFGWAVHLARAYRATGSDKYAHTFWELFAAFSASNPAFFGPNWVSAQEVALRLIHLCITAGEVWQSPSTTPERRKSLAQNISLHAERIPITLAYARAQGNNHQLSEAVGLFTAGRFLPDHTSAKQWCRQGWHEFESAILEQIAPDGTYAQHSTCYHRLLLSLALWLNAIRGEYQFNPAVLCRLQAATHWLDELTRGLGGQAPNLGSNDGSQVISLSSASMANCREIVETCQAVFLGQPPATWNELSSWLGFPTQAGQLNQRPPIESMRRIEAGNSTGFLRTAHFTSRPSHADQLHFDLWWKGLNILLDPGTYRYNASSPWDNRLSGSDVHNTVTVDGLDQMTRAGKFLWLDWAQAKVLEHNPSAIYAQLNFPDHHRLIHTRKVETLSEDSWMITDEIKPNFTDTANHQFRIHWLLPDAIPLATNLPVDQYPGMDSWRVDGSTLTLALSPGRVELDMRCSEAGSDPLFDLYRAGESLQGKLPPRPTWGWYSPTYGVKQPALAWTMTISGNTPITIHTTIHLHPWESDSQSRN